jgi:flagellar biosynthesis/type III secretory pathway protein FliH
MTPGPAAAASHLVRWLVLAGVCALLLGSGAALAIVTISHKSARITQLRRDNDRLGHELDAAQRRGAAAKSALGEVTKELAVSKRQLAKAKKQAAAQFFTGYSSGYSSGTNGTSAAYNNGYTDGYNSGYGDGYNKGLCIDPSDGSYVC